MIINVKVPEFLEFSFIYGIAFMIHYLVVDEMISGKKKYRLVFITLDTCLIHRHTYKLILMQIDFDNYLLLIG